MAQIIVSSEDFPNIVAVYLLEAITRLPDEVNIDNPLFIRLLNKMKLGGIKAYLIQTYLNMDAQDRIKYKYIAKTLFNETSNMAVIRVEPENAEDTEEDE